MFPLLQVTRLAYFRWKKNPKLPEHEVVCNEKLADIARYIYEAENDKGSRKNCEDILNDYGFHIDDERILCTCLKLQIQLIIRYSGNSITKALK